MGEGVEHKRDVVEGCLICNKNRLEVSAPLQQVVFFIVFRMRTKLTACFLGRVQLLMAGKLEW